MRKKNVAKHKESAVQAMPEYAKLANKVGIANAVLQRFPQLDVWFNTNKHVVIAGNDE